MEDQTVKLTIEEIRATTLPFSKQCLVVGKSLVVIPFAIIVFLIQVARDLLYIPGATVDTISLSEKVKLAALKKLEEK